MASSFAPIPLHHAVTIRLTKNNYLLRRAQLLPFRRSTKLISYLDGTLPPPPKQVPASTALDAELLPNPAYDRWYDQDQQVLNVLLSSISVDILHDVVQAKTSKAVWDMLQRQFASATRARTVQIRVKLATTRQRDLSASDYFRKVKRLATELAAADTVLTDEEIIAYLLAGLRADYVNLSLTRSIDRCMFSFLISQGISQGSCACTRARASGCGRRARQGASRAFLMATESWPRFKRWT
jgi:hypothetical protein